MFNSLRLLGQVLHSGSGKSFNELELWEWDFCGISWRSPSPASFTGLGLSVFIVFCSPLRVLLFLCRGISLNPVKASMGRHPRWKERGLLSVLDSVAPAISSACSVDYLDKVSCVSRLPLLSVSRMLLTSGGEKQDEKNLSGNIYKKTLLYCNFYDLFTCLISTGWVSWRLVCVFFSVSLVPSTVPGKLSQGMNLIYGSESWPYFYYQS